MRARLENSFKPSTTKQEFTHTDHALCSHSQLYVDLEIFQELSSPRPRPPSLTIFCSTCKQSKSSDEFHFANRTCDKCILKKRKERRTQKMLSAPIVNCLGFRKMLARDVGKKYCSSCKCLRAPEWFNAERKTCRACIVSRLERRKNSRISISDRKLVVWSQRGSC